MLHHIQETVTSASQHLAQHCFATRTSVRLFPILTVSSNSKVLGLACLSPVYPPASSLVIHDGFRKFKWGQDYQWAIIGVCCRDMREDLTSVFTWCSSSHHTGLSQKNIGIDWICSIQRRNVWTTHDPRGKKKKKNTYKIPWVKRWNNKKSCQN